MKCRLVNVRLPEDWIPAIESCAKADGRPFASFCRDCIGEIVRRRGFEIDGVGSITRGSRTDMATPSGRAKALKNLSVARASRKRVGRRSAA